MINEVTSEHCIYKVRVIFTIVNKDCFDAERLLLLYKQQIGVSCVQVQYPWFRDCFKFDRFLHQPFQVTSQG